jgi:hypothetical protein
MEIFKLGFDMHLFSVVLFKNPCNPHPILAHHFLDQLICVTICLNRFDGMFINRFLKSPLQTLLHVDDISSRGVLKASLEEGL